tara:strand:+ start:1936 stop:2367 length:432 start_codon:yes stop_codon:yes gene_type:complete
MSKRIGVLGCKAMKSSIKLNNMNFTLDQIENIAKDIMSDVEHDGVNVRSTKEGLTRLIKHLKELETHGIQSFDITWNEEDVENAFPEIPEEDRAEVLQNFEDELDNSDGVWDRMWECLNIVGQQFIEQNPPKKELRPTITPQK